MPNIQDVEAIIFDLGGVLLNIDYAATTRYLSQLAHPGAIYSQHQQTSLFDHFERGEISPAAFRSGLREALSIEVSDQRLDDAWNAMLLDFPPSRLALLQDVAQHWPIFLLSNTNQIHKEAFDKTIAAVAAPHAFDDLFEKAYYSHLMGARKPEAKAFAMVCSENRLNPAKTLFIDDTIGHVQGARQFGLQAYHLQGEIEQLFQPWLDQRCGRSLGRHEQN